MRGQERGRSERTGEEEESRGGGKDRRMNRRGTWIYTAAAMQ